MRFWAHIGKGDFQNSNSKFVDRSEEGRKIIRSKLVRITWTSEEDFESVRVFYVQKSKLSIIAVQNWA